MLVLTIRFEDFWGSVMLLTLFLAIVFCAAITLMLLSAVAFIQYKRLFSSAPKQAQAVIRPRTEELFYGARIVGWTLMAFSLLMILGVGVVSIWDGFRSGFSFFQFFLRFALMFTVYKVYDMVCFDYFLLIKIKFFQHHYPEMESVYVNRRYGFNIRSQLLKRIVVTKVLLTPDHPLWPSSPGRVAPMLRSRSGPRFRCLEALRDQDPL